MTEWTRQQQDQLTIEVFNALQIEQNGFGSEMKAVLVSILLTGEVGPTQGPPNQEEYRAACFRLSEEFAELAACDIADILLQ